jgi:hypothetical protein
VAVAVAVAVALAVPAPAPVPDLALAEKVVLLAQVLEKAGIPHAFGGALAFAYYGEPRATVDIDLNLFVGSDAYARTIKVLEPIGVAPSRDPAAVARDGQVRLWWGRTPVDLFFSYDPLHDAMRDGVKNVPFSSTTIPILAPEHLLVAKVAFDRAKDWIDIAQMLVAVPALDLDDVHRWMDRLMGAGDPRQLHLRQLEVELLGGEPPGGG